MAQVGRLGSTVFSTSDARVLTFRELKLKKTSRTSAHNVIAGKPKLERIGPGLDTLTFSVDLLAALGVKPRAEAEKLENKMENGVVDYLIVGNRRVGKNRWLITGISEKWDYIYRRGEVAKITLELTLQEYV